MCDTMVLVTSDGVLFAKNSDRDPNEAQLLDWRPAADHPDGAMLPCTYVSIPQAKHTAAVLLSRPFWMWGAEMGTNEHQVTIGNEAVFTNLTVQPIGLTGMDLVRLGLERSRSADQALDVLRQLLETHGQGGGCGHERRSFRYHNSFLIADPERAWVLETADRQWAVERVQGFRSISNGLSIEPFARRFGDRVRTHFSGCATRSARTRALGKNARGVRELMAILRDHGAVGRGPRWNKSNGGLHAPCVHGGGMFASSQTTASLVAKLTSNGSELWATATSSPCVSLFKPVDVHRAVEYGPDATDQASDHLWWRHERLHRSILRDFDRWAPAIQSERDAIEDRWRSDPPSTADAFEAHARHIEDWLERCDDPGSRDRRPYWLRRYWRRRERWARMDATEC